MPEKKTDKDGESKKPDDSKSSQINDVSKPGRTAATPTSRPIITPRGGMIKQDPMVSGASNDKGVVDEKSESRISAKPELKLKPILDDKPVEDDDKDKAKPETKQEKESAKPEKDDNKDDNKAGAKAEEKQPSEDKADDNTDNEGDESAAIDSLASSASSKKQTAQETEEEKKRSDKIKELAEGKNYYVPIVEGGHKATNERLLSWLILILLLVSVGVYLAIDAGYLDVGIALPYNFIGN